MVDKIKQIGRIIWEWILFFLLPPITLIIAKAFADVFFNMNEITYGILFIVIGIAAAIGETYLLYKKTVEVFK